jgi:hypothetical protein
MTMTPSDTWTPAATMGTLAAMNRALKTLLIPLIAAPGLVGCPESTPPAKAPEAPPEAAPGDVPTTTPPEEAPTGTSEAPATEAPAEGGEAPAAGGGW